MTNHPSRPWIPVLAVLAGLTSVQADYPSTVQSDQPLAYYQLDDDTSRDGVNRNAGSVGASGDATQDLGRVHSIPGAIVGDGNRAVFFDGTSRTQVPWNAAMNPARTEPFTVEAWFKPSSDQAVPGQAPLSNRYAYPGADRTGWVYFQRKPNADHAESEPVGWNFRMFRGSGSSAGMDITSGVPYELGKWTHVVVVYDPADALNATLRIYVDGQEANMAEWTGGADGETPGYASNTSGNDPSQAVFGDAALSLGSYNNTDGTSLNPYFGGIDEFAFYSARLTPEQILEHYQNATNVNRTVSYDALIRSRNPAVYLRLDEITDGPDVSVNLGEARSAGIATHQPEGVRRPAASPLAGDTTAGSVAYNFRNSRRTVTTVPFHELNNPEAGLPFAVELWIRPMSDRQGGQCPLNNRYVRGTGRTGWVIFQRNPNLSYPPSEGHGWNFRMFTGQGGSGQDVVTGVDYVVGEWQHLVFTWEPIAYVDSPGGNDQWEGTLSAYVNGELADQQIRLYAANRNPPEDFDEPSDLGIGAYNAASGLGDNPFEGDIAELVIYNDYVPSLEQIRAHYQAGVNADLGRNYPSLVLSTPFAGKLEETGGPVTQRQGPATYLRFNDTAQYPLANSGTLGKVADGSAVLTANTAPGPRPPAFPGFAGSNTGLALNGTDQWASFNHPSGLDFEGQITLQAWVRPEATQGERARILSHGPQTPSAFLSRFLDYTEDPFEDALVNTTEVFLAIEDGTYTVGSRTSTVDPSLAPAELPVIASHVAAFPVPSSDLGGDQWVHLAGSYDGTHWRLYRNGVEVASAASGTGALRVPRGDWAIGSSGNGWADHFAGGIDEVAIYNRALSPARILAHYQAATQAGTPEIRITIARDANGVVLTWPAGAVLQSAGSVTGPFVDVPGSPASPHSVAFGETTFYRARQ
ncbi:MAG: LamG domain-containing protein [Verrucomicrobiae bacterium]|nr:LamG domain-containing protein [Verrucomicrobiae bacterium]